MDWVLTSFVVIQVAALMFILPQSLQALSLSQRVAESQRTVHALLMSVVLWAGWVGFAAIYWLVILLLVPAIPGLSEHPVYRPGAVTLNAVGYLVPAYYLRRYWRRILS